MIDDIRAAFAEDRGPAALDSETTSIHGLWRDLEIRGISLALGQRTWYLPLTHPHSENLGFSEVKGLLFDLAAGYQERTWCWANAKYDWSVLASTLDLPFNLLPNPQWDVLVGGWLEDENIQARSLKDRCAALFGPDARVPQEHMKRLCAGPTLAELEDEHYYGPAGRVEGAPRQPMGITRAVAHERALVDPRYGAREMWDLTAAEMEPYARQDAALTLDLYRYQTTLDHRHPIGDAMPREMAVARVLLGMERVGIGVDADAAQAAHARAVARLSALDSTFEGLNPASHDQLVDLVFTKWGFPILTRSSKTGSPTADRATLELLGDDPRIVALLEWRRLQKAVTAYYRPLLDAVDADGRVHTSVNQAKVKTGRFSAERPNLFTIPREETIDEIRGIFTPAPGYELWEFDMGQAEVRAAASMARDPALLAALNDPDRDVYQEVAATMEVKRQTAKTLVLADGYGAGPVGLAAQLLKGTGRMMVPADISRAEALQRRLARDYPHMAAAAAFSERIARRDGRIPLPPKGRFRHFRGQGYAPEEYRKAWNCRCQGGIAELLKQLMVVLDKERVWEKHGARFVLTVYDSLAAEVPPGRAPALCADIQAVLNDVSYFRNVRMPLEAKLWKAASPTARSAPASEACPSGSNGPGSAPPSSSRTTPSAARFSRSTGPTSPSSGISPPSTPPNSPASTSSPEASPASPSRRRAASRRSKTRAGSGPMPPVLFGIFGPDGFSSKMSARFSQLPKALRSRLSSGIFPPRGMTRSGSCYVLPTLVLPTNGSGSSSWPTPSATSYGTNRGGSDSSDPRGFSREGKVRPSLETMARGGNWPTPTEADGLGGPGTSGREGGKNLRTEVAHQTASAWPTPSARDWKSPSSNKMDDNARPLNEVVTNGSAGPLNPSWVEALMGFPPGFTSISGLPDPGSRSTHGSHPAPVWESPTAPPGSRHSVTQSFLRSLSWWASTSSPAPVSNELWPTPRVSATRTSRTAATRRDSRSGPSLEQAIELSEGRLPREIDSLDEVADRWTRLWPTPTAGDAKTARNATANRSNPDSKHHSSTTLSDAIILWREDRDTQQ